MLGVNTDASLRAVLGQIEADHKRPDLVLATGDLSQDGEVAAYQRLAGMLQASPALAGARIRCLPGNHDAPDTLRRALPAWSEPVTDVGAWRVICLDTTVPGSTADTCPTASSTCWKARWPRRRNGPRWSPRITTPCRSRTGTTP